MTKENFYEKIGLAVKKDAEVVLDYPEFNVGIRFAGKSNAKYTAEMNRIAPKLAKLERKVKFNVSGANDEAIAILARVYVKSVIIFCDQYQDPDTLKMYKGKENYDPEVFLKVLIAVPELFKDIQEQSTSLNLFKEEENEELVGNLPKPSKKS